MKYNTKPIDFTGCHPVIAEHLKRGEAIECFVWDDEGESKVKALVYGYVPDTAYKYKIIEGGYACAEPLPVKVKIKRIMPPERAIPVLIAEGWKFNSKGNIAGPSGTLTPYQYSLMGTSLDGEAGDYDWPPCIIEECDE